MFGGDNDELETNELELRLEFSDLGSASNPFGNVLLSPKQNVHTLIFDDLSTNLKN